MGKRDVKSRPLGFLVIVALALGILVAPLAADAQPPRKVYRIGVLSTAPRVQVSHLLKALADGLRDLGYIEGRNIAVEYRSAEGRLDRLPELAAEFVRLKLDAIIPTSTPAAIAVKQATTTIPIVMVSPADPVSAGLVASLARPGGNITGVTLEITLETLGKQLQLLREVVPKVRRVAVLWNPAYEPNAARWKAIREPARRLGLSLLSAEVGGPGDIERAFPTMIREHVDGLLVLGDPLMFSLRRQIADLAAKQRLPTVSPYKEGADAGCLISYGADFPQTYRRAATYVDKILKGAKPDELPVEQPTKFEFVINLKTAKALALRIPQSILVRADQVIQ
jgi:putative ABC transport system substrate-binding protein